MRRSWTDGQLIEAINACTSFREVATQLGLSKSSVTDLKIRANFLQADYSHFRAGGYKEKPFDSLVSRHAIKKRLLRDGILENKCYSCGITDWRGQPLSLELEHIDGNRSNNTVENLTLLCPNCHSQTPTFRGRNKGNYGSLV